LIGLTTAYLLPRSYESTAKLWALRLYDINDQTNLANDPSATPAHTQAAALGQLLQTRTFALVVAHETSLASTLSLDANTARNPQLMDDALFNEISRNVQVTDRGNNLFVISYKNRDPKLAQQVVAAVVRHYAMQAQSLALDSGQGARTNNLFTVIDAPMVAIQPASRLGLLLAAGGIGLALAMLACSLYIIILVRCDRTMYTPPDIQKVLALPVVAQLPHLTPTTISALFDGTVPVH